MKTATVLSNFEQAAWLVSEVDPGITISECVQDSTGGLITVFGKVFVRKAGTGRKTGVSVSSRFLVKFYVKETPEEIAVILLDEFSQHRREVVRREMGLLWSESEEKSR